MEFNISQIPSSCYLLDEKLLRRNLEIISKVRKEAQVEIILALKGFAMWSVFPILREYGFDTCTASSYNEARLAYEEMGNPAHTFCAAYDPKDFLETAQLSSHLTFNSIKQLHQFLPILKKMDNPPSVGLRVNHEFSEVKTLLYNPCAPGSRLGITMEHFINGLPSAVDGLHFHSLCESKSFDLEKALQAFESKFGDMLPQCKWVNFGGGHLMTHQDYDTLHLIKILKEFKARHPHLHVIMEPGAAFAWETGYLVATVLDIVENKGIRTAMLDVSFTGHMPDCLEMPYQPNIVGASTLEIPGKPCYRMGGNSCLSGDYMGNWWFDDELEVGQKIVFLDMIHYTMVKTTFFNGINHPSIAIWTQDNQLKMVREFGYEDFRNKLS